MKNRCCFKLLHRHDITTTSIKTSESRMTTVTALDLTYQSHITALATVKSERSVKLVQGLAKSRAVLSYKGLVDSAVRGIVEATFSAQLPNRLRSTQTDRPLAMQTDLLT